MIKLDSFTSLFYFKNGLSYQEFFFFNNESTIPIDILDAYKWDSVLNDIKSLKGESLT